MREKLPGEITPMGAEQSSTYKSQVASYGIDGDLFTSAILLPHGPGWYRVKFDGIKCLSQVKWFRGPSAIPILTWDCNESGCGVCTGSIWCDEGRYPVIVSAERASTDGLKPPSGCVYGDTFELQHSVGFLVHEIAFIGKDAEVDPCFEVKGKLQESEKKVESLEADLKEEKEKTSGLAAGLEKAQKEICPGRGIWSVPDNVVGKKITKKMIKNWKKNGLKDNIKYLGFLKGVKITEKLAKYVECHMTV